MSKGVGRYVVRGLLIVLGVIVLLVAPAGIQYARYGWANEDLPAERLDVVEPHAANMAPAGFDEAARALVRKHMSEASMPGLSVTIAEGDSFLWSVGFGYADIAAEKPVDDGARFRIGSTAKAITGIVLGRLLEAGSISLERPIGEYVDDLPERIQPITPRQLASHTGGIRHYAAKDLNPYTGNPWTLDRKGLAIFIDDPLEFEPGTGFRYSTYGFTLLAVTMEGATGRDFLGLVADEVCEPAGMTATSGDLPDADVPGRVTFYTTTDGKYTDALPQNVSYKWAGGGIVASSLDLVRMGEALLNGDLMSDSIRTILWTSVLLADGSDNPQNYALGWRRDMSTRLLGEERPTLLLHHGGMQIGGASFFAIFPEHGIVAAALTNTGDRAARMAVQELVYDLTRLVLGETPPDAS